MLLLKDGGAVLLTAVDAERNIVFLKEPQAGATAPSVAFSPRLCAAREHRVFGGHPATSLALAPHRDALFHGRGAEHPRRALTDGDASLCIREHVHLDVGGAERVTGSAIGAHQRRNTFESTRIEAS